jgi:hypothetical protein
VYKYTVLFALLLSLFSLAQQPQNKTQPKSATKSSGETSEPADTHALSKDYRKSAIAAMSSVDNWHKKSIEVPECTNEAKIAADLSRINAEYTYRMTVAHGRDFAAEAKQPDLDRRAAETARAAQTSVDREMDAAERAKKDVKMAKVDVVTPADSFLQEKLEAYLDVLPTLSYSHTHPNERYDSSTKLRIDSWVGESTTTTCAVLIETALDEGSTVDFEKHPEMKCE